MYDFQYFDIFSNDSEEKNSSVFWSPRFLSRRFSPTRIVFLALKLNFLANGLAVSRSEVTFDGESEFRVFGAPNPLATRLSPFRLKTL